MVPRQIPPPLTRLLALIPCLVLLSAAEGDTARFRAVHSGAVVVDGHNDVLQRVLSGADIARRGTAGHSDLPRFRDGGVDVQVFSLWTAPEVTRRGEGWARVQLLFDSLDALVARQPGAVVKARNGAHVRSAVESGRLAAIAGLEGAAALQAPTPGEEFARVRALHARGLRVFGLTWNDSPAWATSCTDEAGHGRTSPGLTDQGRALVRLLNDLGIIIDISHSGERTIADVLAASRAPVIASHSSCAALRAHPRNLGDAQLRALAANGGVVMMNFLPYFLRDGLTAKSMKRAAKYNKDVRTLLAKGSPSALGKIDGIIARAHREGCATLLDLADHIDHAVQTAGVAHVGLGSDFDGIADTPVGLPDVTALPLLTRELLRRGYSETDVRRILGGNFLRVFDAVCK